MRCSKCGYISFDSLDSCSKCATSLADLINEVKGTAFRVEQPFFLGSLIGSNSAMMGVEEAGIEMDLSMSEEEMQQLDASLDEEISLEEDDVSGIDLSDLDDTLPDQSAKAAAPVPAETEEAEDEVLDLSDLMDEEDL